MKRLKFKSAEEKRRYEENQRSWEQLKAKYAPKKPIKAVADSSWSAGVVVPVGRESNRLPSRTTSGGGAFHRSNLKYTGDKIVGIGMMHKSNFVPVFKAEEAKDLASMRR